MRNNLLLIMCFLFSACTAGVTREWSGHPDEEFQHDKKACKYAAYFESCMQGKGWHMNRIDGTGIDKR